MGSEQSTVRRWQRHGHDRWYVSSGERKLGWIDARSGELHPGEDVSVEELRAAAGSHLPGPGVAPELAGPDLPAPRVSIAVPVLPLPVPVTAAQLAPVRDLAEIRPGQAARERADQELRAQRARSRFRSMLARVSDAKTDERAWRVGAAAEEKVGAKLEAKLGSRGWRVLHSIPVGEKGADIDHLLIGPGGVFTINTKSHPGKSITVTKASVRVGGFSTRYLPKARYEAERAARLLTLAAGELVQVRACLVLLTGTLIPQVTYRELPDAVVPLDRTDYVSWFRQRPVALDPSRVERLYEVARKPATWGG